MKIDTSTIVSVAYCICMVVLLMAIIILHGFETARYKAKLEDREASVSRLEKKLDEIHRVVCGESK